MNPQELLRIVDSLHRDKNIEPEIVFQAIEAALVSAAKRQYGETAEIEVSIARDDGTLTASRDGQPLDQDEIGRIGAQTAKQVIIQKIREAERDSLVEEYTEQMDQIVNGIIHRNEGAAATVSLGSVEAILPRSEQIPGESHHPNERIRAIIFDVRPQGTRVKVVLSRTRPKLVQRLFEQEIPEISEGVISIHAVAREPGHRSKIAVSSIDPRVDCVGACVGVRGNRIKNIVDELGGTERIDIVRWEDDPEQLIPNALQPAEVDQVLLCDMIGRAIVLVREDQLSLAIGRRGQNVRLASKLCGWDIELYTADELEEQIERAVKAYASLDGVDEELAQRLVEQGYLSYDDLSVIEPDAFMELGDLTEEQVDEIVTQAEARAEAAEQAAAEQRRLQKEQQKEQELADKLKQEKEAAEKEAADGEAADGEAADGPIARLAAAEAADGEAADGEAADGEAAEGEAAEGEAADGEAAEGEAADGEAADGEAAEGEAADGEAAEGEAAEGEAAEGEAADGEAAEGEAADGEAADGEAADGEAADGEAADGEAADGEAADGEAADGEAADGEAADGEAADGEAADGEAADGEAADGEAADGGS